MIVELRPKATLALPKEIAKELKLSTGDKFSLVVEDGVIKLTPVLIVKKKLVKQLRQNVNKLKKVSGENESPELVGIEEVVTKIEEE